MKEVAVAAIAASLEIVEVFAGLVAVEIELKIMWMSWLSRH
jgi:hypothetical protein